MRPIAFVNQPLGPIAIPIRAGSLGIWLYQVARRLTDRYDVRAYAMKGRGQSPTARDQDVDYVRVPHFPDEQLNRLVRMQSKLFGDGTPDFASPWHHRCYATRVARDLQAHPCDKIFFFNFFQFAPILARHNPASKLVLDMQCEWLTQLPRERVRPHLDHVDLILGCSDYITNKIRQRFPELHDRCATVHNGVDFDHFAGAVAESAAAKSDRPELLFVGRVSPEKAIHVLVEAMKPVVQRFPDCRLNVVGPEAIAPLDYIVGISDEPHVAGLRRFYQRSYLQQLEEQAHSLGVADNVRFVGPVPHEKLLDFYRSADILVNPSFSESFGMSLVEAGAAGVPVIGARVGGMTEIIDEGVSGLIVDPGDAGGLAGAIERLLESPETRAAMAAAGRKRARECFAWDRIADSLDERYRVLDRPT